MSTEAISSNIALANLSLLQESDLQLKHYALQQLHRNVDYCWHQVSEHIVYIEQLYEDDQFPHRELAASLASKVYYNLEDYDEALNYALESGDYLNLDNTDLYTQQMITKCVNNYIDIRRSNYEIQDSSQHQKINQKLESIVNRLFEKCEQDKEYKQALGIAIESRRVDEVTKILDLCKASLEILNYLFEITQKIVSSKKFKQEILRIIVNYSKQHSTKSPSDYLMISQCLYKLDDHEHLARILEELATSNTTVNTLVAFQIAADIYDNDSPNFTLQLFNLLNSSEKTYEQKSRILELLEGKFQRNTNLEFLSLMNKTDPQIIKNYKEIVDNKQSVPHLGVVISNALQNLGTLNDNFLRDNLEWVGKCTHWSKFTTTASLGVIHRGNTTKAREILNPYFPGQMPTPNWHTHGGSLYGLGLVYGGIKHQDTINYLIDMIKNPTYNQHEEVVNGACLGIGLTGFASADQNLYEELKNVLFTDSAVTGEASAIAIGLIMVGSQNQEIIEELLQYAHETQHEKIIRSIAISLAIIMFGREEAADTLIEQLLQEKDALLRFGSMFMMGMAYIGTGNSKILKRLLHYAVSDNSDDVRRAAVISLGFLLLKDHEQVPKIINLLGLSFNPHVRYGAALALGISCNGTLLPEAINMLEPLLNDNIDFVRQGAFVGLSMILHQSNANLEPKVDKLKENIKEVVQKKHEDPLCKLGAFLASGILDVGGRNQMITLLSQTGNPKTAACVGMLLFTQFWYWFPYTLFFSLSLSPSAIIGVDKDLKIPKSFEFVSNTRSSLYEYPDPVKPVNVKDQAKKEAVALSTTARVRARANLRRGDMEVEKEADKQKETDKEKKLTEGKMEEEKESEKPKEEETKKEEKVFIVYNNPARILARQMKFVTYSSKNRYQPVFQERKRGYIFLNDTNENAGQAQEEYFPEYLKSKQQTAPNQPPSGDTVPPPESFVFDETAQTETSAK